MTLLEQIKADREAGTPGPWSWSEPYEGYYEGSCGEAWLGGIDPDVCDFGNDTHYYPSEGTPPSPPDARRIARVPDLEAALLAAEWAADELENQLKNCPLCKGEKLAVHGIDRIRGNLEKCECRRCKHGWDALAAYRKATEAAE